MKQPELFTSIADEYTAYETHRRRTIAHSDNALNRSKRAIFAMHRGDWDDVDALLQEADRLFASCEDDFASHPKLAYEGAHRAALEEYVEAVLFYDYLKNETIGSVPDRARRPDVYLAGLCDMTGEVVRFATRQATDRKYEHVARAAAFVDMVVTFLSELNLRGHVRNKADQAKRNLKRLEEMRYEIALRTE